MASDEIKIKLVLDKSTAEGLKGIAAAARGLADAIEAFVNKSGEDKHENV